jgi:hypothetical protein
MGDRPQRRPRSLPANEERSDTTAPTFTGSISKVGRL